MSRYDKYDPIAGGFRAPLAADWPRVDAVDGVIYGIGLNASGQIVKGAGVTGILGALVLTQAAQLSVAKHKAGDWVDVMHHGDIVEFATSAGVLGVAGFNYYITAATGLVVAGTGAGGSTQPSGSVYLGTTVEVGASSGPRLVVNYSKVPASA